MLKGFLSQNNIPFTEVNVEKDLLMMQKVVKQTGQMGVPQTEINGKWVIEPPFCFYLSLPLWVFLN